MKTALVLCSQWDVTYPAYSLALLKALLKRRGHEVSFFDLNQEMHALSVIVGSADFGGYPTALNPWTDADSVSERLSNDYREYLESAARRILSQGPAIVGFSVHFSNAIMSLAVARSLKRLDPGVKIVLGGPNLYDFGRCLEYVRFPEVDAVLCGEADQSLPRLVDGFERSGRLQAAPGVLLRADERSWTEGGQPVSDLDSLPFADYAGHRWPIYGKNKTLHSCRGCVRRCVFCSDWREKSFRQMSARRMVDEIDHQLRQTPDITHFFFADSIFNASIRRTKDFCEALLRDGRPVSWESYAITRQEMDRPLLETMRAAGCRWLFYGVESGSARVLRDMDKPVSPGVNAAVIQDTKAAGISANVLMIVGFPTETEEDFQRTMDFVTDNSPAIGALAITPFSTYEMQAEAGRFAFTTDHPLYWRTTDGENTYPVRVDRFRRLVRRAAENGVRASLEGFGGLAELDGYCDSLLAGYRRWSERCVAAA